MQIGTAAMQMPLYPNYLGCTPLTGWNYDPTVWYNYPSQEVESLTFPVLSCVQTTMAYYPIEGVSYEDWNSQMPAYPLYPVPEEQLLQQQTSEEEQALQVTVEAPVDEPIDMKPF